MIIQSAKNQYHLLGKQNKFENQKYPILFKITRKNKTKIGKTRKLMQN